MNQILQTITKLNDSKFNEIKRHYKSDKKIKMLYDNLWSMFDIEYYKSGQYKSLEDKFIDALDNEKEILSVSNFAWTTQVKNEFYNHPYNKYATSLFKRDKASHSMFILDCEPTEIK